MYICLCRAIRAYVCVCVCACCSGIIMYAMVLGRLPFCTPFKDEYHRQRMLQQIHKGLSPVHDREMQPLSPGECFRRASEREKLAQFLDGAGWRLAAVARCCSSRISCVLPAMTKNERQIQTQRRRLPHNYYFPHGIDRSCGEGTIHVVFGHSPAMKMTNQFNKLSRLQYINAKPANSR
jgi:hypothetical protein